MTGTNDALAYRESVDGCRFLLEQELEKPKKGETGENDYFFTPDAYAIADKAAGYAVTLYCTHLTKTLQGGARPGIGARLCAMRDTLGDIVAQPEKNGSAQQFFRSMQVLYTRPDYETYVGKGAYGIVANMFAAAANEKNIEGPFNNNATGRKP